MTGSVVDVVVIDVFGATCLAANRSNIIGAISLAANLKDVNELSDVVTGSVLGDAGTDIFGTGATLLVAD